MVGLPRWMTAGGAEEVSRSDPCVQAAGFAVICSSVRSGVCFYAPFGRFAPLSVVTLVEGCHTCCTWLLAVVA